MKIAIVGIALATRVWPPAWRMRNRCFAATPRTPARIAAQGPRQFHRVKWKFPTGDRIVSSPVFADGVIYFGGDDGNVYAVDAADGRQTLEAQDRRPGRGDAGDRRRDAVRRQLRRQVLRARRAHRQRRAGSSRPRASGASRRRACTACSRRTRRSPIRSTSSCRARSWRAARCIFGSGDGNVYALDAASGELEMEIPDRRRRARLARVRRRRRVLRQLGQLLLRGRRADRRGEMALSRRRGSGDPQPGRIPVVARGRRTASCTPAAGTRISTRSTRRPARRSGASTTAEAG